MDLSGLPENEKVIGLFLISFGKLVPHSKLYPAVQQIHDTLDPKTFIYLSTGKLTDLIVDYLICFDEFLKTPKSILEIILIELTPSLEIKKSVEKFMKSRKLNKIIKLN